MEYEQNFYGRSSRDPARDRPTPQRLGSGGTVALIGVVVAAFVVAGLTAVNGRSNEASAEAAPTQPIPVASTAGW